MCKGRPHLSEAQERNMLWDLPPVISVCISTIEFATNPFIHNDGFHPQNYSEYQDEVEAYFFRSLISSIGATNTA